MMQDFQGFIDDSSQIVDHMWYDNLSLIEVSIHCQ